jgi:nucleotide-binding universal stress UspA family protein
MIEPPYRTVAVASTFSPRFLQVLAEAKRIRDRLCREMHVIFVGSRDEETTRRFTSALRELELPENSPIHYHEGDPAVAILEAARANQIDLVVAGALEKESVLRQFLGNVARRLVREATCSVMLFTKPARPPEPFRRIVLLAQYSEHGCAALHKALRLAALEQCDKLYVIRLYTTFDEARAKARTGGAPAIDEEGARTLEEEEAALEHFIDSAGSTEVPIEARCIRGNTGYAVLDFVQSVDATMLAIPDPPNTVGLPAHIEWVTDVIPCNLWVIR